MSAKKFNLNIPLLESELEKPILEYKFFYLTHLLNVKNKPRLIQRLNPLLLEFKNNRPKTIFISDPVKIQLEGKIASVLKDVGDEVLELYNKKLPVDSKPKNTEPYEGFWQSLFVALSQSFEAMHKQNEYEWNYKTNFLSFLIDCLESYGLHKNILLRNSKKYKRFNITISHYYRSQTPLLAFRSFLTHDELESEFLALYKKQKPVKFKGVLVPFDKIHEVKITTCFFLEDEIQLFALKNGFKWSADQKDIEKFINCCPDETEKYHPNPYAEESQVMKVEVLSLDEISNLLAPYPGSQTLYNNAIEKSKEGIYQRNVLDDLRLSIELLLKDIFDNDKSLENQLSEVGKLQKDRGGSSELTSMFRQLLDLYSKYQNKYVKHNDSVKSNEVEFVFDLTSSFLKYIIKINKN